MTSVEAIQRPDTCDYTDPVPWLMYHSIDTAATPDFAEYVVDPGMFREHLDYLVQQGFTTVTASALMGLRHTNVPPLKRTIVLTFDDAYADFLTTALPELVARGLTATLYVPTKYVDGTARWLQNCGEERRPILSWSALADVASAGIEIAAHSHSHSQLDLLDAAPARDEVHRSRQSLEQKLGVQVRGFAYPFGYWNRVVRAAVASAGFEYGCQVGELTSLRTHDPLAVPRHSVRAGMGTRELESVLASKTTRYSEGVSMAKRLAWQGVRRLTGAKRSAAEGMA